MQPNTRTAMLLIADILADRLQPAAYELAEFARRHPDIAGDHTQMAFVGGQVQTIARETAGLTGIDGIVVENDALYYPDMELLAQCLVPIVQRLNPRMIVFIHSIRATQAAAALAWKLNGSCIPGVEAMERDKDGLPVFRRAITGGKQIVEVKPDAIPVIVTIMPGAFAARDRIPHPGPAGKIEIVSSEDTSPATSLKLEPAATSDNSLEEADVIVAAGRGIGAPEHLGMIRELAAMFNNAAVGASRPLCDLGWMPINRQIGVTGRTVAPKLYLACGISGTQQHVAGMRGSRLIVALNHDRHAPIFNIAHIGIVENLHAFLPVLMEKCRERKP